LGIKNGIRYWKLENNTIRDPLLAPKICKALNADAIKLRAAGYEIQAFLTEEWADQLNKTNTQFHKNKK
jgi:hypothetical protein